MAALTLTTGARSSARLVAAADGSRSKLRALADIADDELVDGQSGIVATIAHERDHEGLAEQHFLPAGPFATLPMKGRPLQPRLERAPEEAERCAPRRS